MTIKMRSSDFPFEIITLTNSLFKLAGDLLRAALRDIRAVE